MLMDFHTKKKRPQSHKRSSRPADDWLLDTFDLCWVFWCKKTRFNVIYCKWDHEQTSTSQSVFLVMENWVKKKRGEETLIEFLKLEEEEEEEEQEEEEDEEEE